MWKWPNVANHRKSTWSYKLKLWSHSSGTSELIPFSSTRRCSFHACLFQCKCSDDGIATVMISIYRTWKFIRDAAEVPRQKVSATKRHTPPISENTQPFLFLPSVIFVSGIQLCDLRVLIVVSIRCRVIRDQWAPYPLPSSYLSNCGYKTGLAQIWS